MLGKALLIGSGIDGLSGAAADVAAMKELLGRYDLYVVTCEGAAATRDGILAAYRQLIDSVGPNDAAVVYYTGHGGRVTAPPSGRGGPDPMDLQWIAPFDIHDSTPDDFRGITSIELSVLLSELTDKTRNVTVILDCCHAGLMSRDVGLRVKGMSTEIPYEYVRSHIDKLVQEGRLDIKRFRSAGSTIAVRIVACEQYQLANEDMGAQPMGLLTRALTTTLAAAGSARLPWAAVMDSVRRQVLRTAPGQRPALEGPARRLVFSLDEEDLAALTVFPVAGGRGQIECAPLLGVQLSDEFMIMPAGTVDADPATKIGDLKVDTIGPMSASGPVTLAGSWSEMPLDARAFRTRAAAPAIPVAVPHDDPRATSVANAINDAPLLRLAQAGETPVAEVRIDADGGLTLHDRIGPLHAPRPAGNAGLAQMIRDLKAMAQADALRGLSSDPQWALKAEVSIEWGRVDNGERVPLDPHGATVRTGDSIYVAVGNRSQENIFVSLIDIGVSGRIAVLTSATLGGRRIEPGREWIFGLEEFAGKLTGLPVFWPDGLEAATARPETLLLLVTSEPQDIGPLEHPGVARGDVPGTSPLEQLIGQLATGRTRDVKRIDGPPIRYDVHTIDFDLGPIPDEGRFALDERPDPATLFLTPKGMPPQTVAVRIEDLIIHRNRALFGANIRIDTLVVTGQAANGKPAYRAHTVRFPGIDDGEALPLDRMLVFYGPAVDYLDLALWVSRDAGDGSTLGDLLSKDLNGDEVQDALSTLAGALTAVPHAAAAATLIGAGAIVINVAYRALRKLTGNSIGVYRGSRLAAEQFGVGRHPQVGCRQIQDFSIAYSIERAS